MCQYFICKAQLHLKVNILAEQHQTCSLHKKKKVYLSPRMRFKMQNECHAKYVEFFHILGPNVCLPKKNFKNVILFFFNVFYTLHMLQILYTTHVINYTLYIYTMYIYSISRDIVSQI